MKKTLIIGATTNPERYAFKAAEKLKKFGHEIIPFGIKKGEVAGETIVNQWESFKGVDTVTLYVGPANQSDYIDKIISIQPKRVIFNPGTESKESEDAFNAAGIEVEEACTLVLLSIGNY